MKTILVIDDHAEMLSAVRAILEGAGYVVHTAEDWYIAGQMSNNNTYDLILSDNQLGENRNHWGTNLIPRLKRHQPQAKTVLMSTDEVLDHPADAFILKLKLGSELVPLIKSLIG